MSLEQLEELRIKARNRKILIGILSGISIVGCFILSIIVNIDGIVYLGPLVVGVVYAALASPIHEYSEKYKEIFVETELKQTFDHLIYRPFDGISETVIKNTDMMKMSDIYESNDYIEADYNGVHFKQSDVSIKQKVKSSTITLFKGRWMIFDFNKEFKTNMQIIHKGFSNSANPNNTIFNRPDLKYETIKVENEKFNDTYIIRTQDEHNTYYILTPHLMEKMLQITSEMGRQMMFCFIDNQLHIAIYTGTDSFENSAFHKLDPQKEKESILKDIALITSFVDELNLDRKIFKE